MKNSKWPKKLWFIVPDWRKVGISDGLGATGGHVGKEPALSLQLCMLHSQNPPRSLTFLTDLLLVRDDSRCWITRETTALIPRVLLLQSNRSQWTTQQEPVWDTLLYTLLIDQKLMWHRGKVQGSPLNVLQLLGIYSKKRQTWKYTKGWNIKKTFGVVKGHYRDSCCHTLLTDQPVWQ